MASLKHNIYRCQICSCGHINFPRQHLFGCIAEAHGLRNTVQKATDDGWYVEFFKGALKERGVLISRLQFDRQSLPPYLIFLPEPTRVVFRTSTFSRALTNLHHILSQQS